VNASAEFELEKTGYLFQYAEREREREI